MPSQLFKDNIYKLGRQTKAEVSFSLVAPEAKELATITKPPENSLSRGTQIIDNITNMSTKIATFEPDYWKLDGSFVLPLTPSQSNIQVGYWGNELSGADGAFNNIPTISITFSQVQNIRRFGIAFDEPSNNYCTDIQFTVYNSSNAIIYDERIENDSPYAHSTSGAMGVYRIVIKLYKTNMPYRYLRISELDFGIVIRFNNDDIVSLSLTIEGDPTGRSFPYPQLSLSIANNERFDPLDSESYAGYLYARQPFEYRHGLVLPDGSVEWVYMGAYYLQDKDISDDRVNFTCVGKTSVIEEFTFYSSSLQELTLGAFIEKVLDELKFDTYIDAVLYNSPVITAYTGNISYRNVFALLSEISSCLAFENQENTIIFKDILSNGTAVDILDYDNILTQPKVKQEQYYNGINLTEYDISVEQGQLSKVTVDVSGSKDIAIYFDGPQQGNSTYTITSGFTLANVKYYTMYMTARLTGNGSATITVSGQKINFASSETFYAAPWRDPLEPEYPYSINLPMMIKTKNYPAFRDWFLNRKFDLLQKRLSCEIDWLGNFALQIGNTANVQINKKGSSLNMITARHSIDFNGGVLRGGTKLVGDTP